MSYQIIARKYRPMTFEQVVGQKAVVQTLQNAIKTNRVAQAYIFSGMRGVGKTTMARILAKALNCKEGPTPTPCDNCESCTSINEDRSVDVLEIDGASNRGIDDIRTLRDAVKYKPLHSRNKIIYIDEVHQITREGFNALLKTLEEPPPGTVFIFATTELHKVPPTIVSRCQHFEFKKLSQKEIVNHLLRIARAENLTITPAALSLIAQAAEGSMRDAQSLLDQAVAFSGQDIRDEDLKEILGAIDQDLLFAASSLVFAQDPAAVFPLVEKIMERGYDLRAFHKDLILHFRNLLLAKSVEDLGELLPLNADEQAALRKEADQATAEELLRCLHVLQEAESGLRYSSQPQIYLETLLVRLSHISKIVPITDLVREVERLKGGGFGASGGGGEAASARREAPKNAPQKPTAPRSSAAAPSAAPDPFAPTMPPVVKPAQPVTPIPSEASVPPASPPKPLDEKAFWQRLIAELEKEKSSVAAILSREAAFRLRDESADIKFSTDKGFILDNPAVLEISFPTGDSVFRDAVHGETRTIERIASGINGRKVKLRLADTVAQQTPRKEKLTDTALKDPGVRAFMDVFRGQIYTVEPVSGAKESEEA
jgi:DNA polymerase III subunit gamma/tau